MFSLPSVSGTAVLGLLGCAASVAQASSSSSSSSSSSDSCAWFKSDGVANGTFSYYRFYDFRHVSPMPAPPPPPAPSKSGPPSPARSKVVDSAAWVQDWFIRNDEIKADEPLIPLWFMTRNINVLKSNDSSPDYGSFLSLNTSRPDLTDQDGAEMSYSEYNISYASIQVKARVRGDTGAVAGIFTWYDDETESDIEVRTRDPDDMIHYSNQPSSSGPPDWSPVPNATVNCSIADGGRWSDWHVHRIDWVPGLSAFWVDGDMLHQMTVNVPKPDPASRFFLEMFSQNSSWSGSMPVGGVAAMDVQWVQLMFNTTDEPDSSKGGPQDICQPDPASAGQVKDTSKSKPKSSAALPSTPLQSVTWTALWSAVVLLSMAF